MNRRRVLAALGGLGLTGGSAWVLQQDAGTEDALPMQVRTVDAPGSEAGGVRLPVEDTVTVLDLFATWCSPCAEQMGTLAAVHGEYADEVAMISVTNERLGGTLSKADLRDWWREHDGAWTLGLDPDSDLMSALGADGLPYLIVFDAEGTPRWQHRGLVDRQPLATHLDRVLAE
jgi:thiol-disulfide isomerase/thioredoxin